MKLLRYFSYAILLLTIIGCGGGGSLSRDDTSSTPDDIDSSNITLTLSIASESISNAEPGLVTATLLNGSSPLTQQVISFSTDIGELSPSSGTALTNENGIAEITLTAGDIRGAGTITGTFNESVIGSVNFITQGDDISVGGDVNITLSLVNSNGDTTQTITSSNPGQVIATIDGISVPVIVTFESTVGDIPIATAITDENNQAVVDILAGSVLGAGTITATVDTGEIGTALLIVGSTTVSMGSGIPFEEGVADISLAQISAGGTSVITVDIVDEGGSAFTEAIDVNFTSTCADAGTSIISSPITTSNGTASSTYLAQGCVGDDVITVTASAGGINLSASGSINVLSADVGSIEFISASPENISLLGTGALGGSESSTLVFRVLDTNGDPVNNQDVNFLLNTDVGGILLNNISATTNSEGLVQTVINSGTIATTVRVQASITNSVPEIASQSSVLVISTGIPDQDSFSLSATTLNTEAWDIDGQEVEFTARLADAFNNPVPDGTAVSFTTEGGSIESSCVTINGACTVIWTSQEPRPIGQILGDVNNLTAVPEEVNTLGQSFGGRATVLATAIGEESFPDTNGNGRFDEDEYIRFLGNDTSGQPFDLDEAFVDHNEDGLYNPSEGGDVNESGSLETFVDFDNSGSFNSNDTLYNGVLCASDNSANCSSQTSLNVRSSIVLVMSGSEAFFTTNSTSDAISATIDDDNDDLTPEVANPNFDSTDNTVYIAGESTGSASVVIADLHNQPMPAGTTVAFTATVGSVQGISSFTWPNDNHNGGRIYGVSIQGQEDAGSGLLIVDVTTPSGQVTTYNTIRIVIQ